MHGKDDETWKIEEKEEARNPCNTFPLSIIIRILISVEHQNY